MKLIAWVRAHMIRDAAVCYRFWSIRLQIFWAAVSGLYMAWPAFYILVPLEWFVGMSIAMSVAIACSRLFNQPGVPKE